MAQSGQFSEPVSEAQLVSLLEKVSGTQQETKVKVRIFFIYRILTRLVHSKETWWWRWWLLNNKGFYEEQSRTIIKLQKMRDGKKHNNVYDNIFIRV